MRVCLCKLKVTSFNLCWHEIRSLAEFYWNVSVRWKNSSPSRNWFTQRLVRILAFRSCVQCICCLSNPWSFFVHPQESHGRCMFSWTMGRHLAVILLSVLRVLYQTQSRFSMATQYVKSGVSKSSHYNASAVKNPAKLSAVWYYCR